MKQWMANMFHVHPDLVGASCFQLALNESNISKAFQNFVMCNGIFAMFTIGISVKNLTKPLMPADMCANRAAFFFYISPNQGHILAVNRMLIKLLGEAGNRFFS